MKLRSFALLLLPLLGLRRNVARLSAAHVDLVRQWLLVDRMGNTAIAERLLKEYGVSITSQAVAPYRRALLPEILAGDLEAVQAGAARFSERIAALGVDIAHLEKEARSLPAKGAAFPLQIVAMLHRELSNLQDGAYKRVETREAWEERAKQDRAKVKIEQERLELEKAARAEAADRWQLEKFAIEREKRILERADEAEEA